VSTVDAGRAVGLNMMHFYASVLLGITAQKFKAPFYGPVSNANRSVSKEFIPPILF